MDCPPACVKSVMHNGFCKTPTYLCRTTNSNTANYCSIMESQTTCEHLYSCLLWWKFLKRKPDQTENRITQLKFVLFHGSQLIVKYTDGDCKIVPNGLMESLLDKVLVNINVLQHKIKYSLAVKLSGGTAVQRVESLEKAHDKVCR